MFGTKAPASGMAMMLKSMGIDVEKIQAEINGQVNALLQTAQSIDSRLKRIEERLTAIEESHGRTDSSQG